MRVTCPRCHLEGVIETGPLMLQARVLCVRCATSYEAVLMDDEVETVSPLAIAQQHEAEQAQPLESNALETEQAADKPLQMTDEPLELPAPVQMEEASMQAETVLEEPVLEEFAAQSASEDEAAESVPFMPVEEAQPESAQAAETENEIPPLALDSFAPREADESPSTEQVLWPYEGKPLTEESAHAAAHDESEPLPEQSAAVWPEAEETTAWSSEPLSLEEEEEEPASLSASSSVDSVDAAPLAEDEVSPAILDLSEPLTSPSSSPMSTSSANSFSSLDSTFEAEVLPADKTENLQQDAALDVSQAPESLGMDKQPPQVGFVQTQKDLPYADKYSLGVRLMRVSPIWLLGSGLLFISLIFVFNWATKPNAQATNLTFNHSLANTATSPTPRQAATQQPTPAQEAQAKGNAQPEQNPATLASTPSSASDNAPSAKDAAAKNAAPADSQPARQVPAVPTPAPEAKPAQSVNAGSGRYAVQVGSYNESAKAEERAAELKSAGFDARVIAVEIPKRGTWYRVQAGRFGTREEAARHGEKLRAQRAATETIVTETGNE